MIQDDSKSNVGSLVCNLKINRKKRVLDVKVCILSKCDISRAFELAEERITI